MNARSSIPIRRDIVVTSPTTPLNGRLVVPEEPAGVVLLARGPADGRHGPLVASVAELVNGAGFATLSVDLIADSERNAGPPPHDVAVLGARIVRSTHWILRQPSLRGLGVGLWSMEDTASAALIAAAYLGEDLDALATYQPRLNVGPTVLRRVTAPSLFVAIDRDTDFAEAIRAEMAVMPGPTELFTTEASLAAIHHMTPSEVVGRVASRFFRQWLPRKRRRIR